MSKKFISGLMWIMLSVGMLAFNTQASKCFYCPVGTIYIRFDGSVDPGTAPIVRDGDVYTLTDNIDDSIVVERDSIAIDGAGYALQKLGGETGIDLSERRNVTIRNMAIQKFLVGILLENSSTCSIFGNDISDNGFGILLVLSSNNFIYCNNFVNNSFQANTDPDSINAWDDGSEGNYWSNYEKRHLDAQKADGSGVWDTAYVVNERNQDYYPLVKPWRFSTGDLNDDGIVDILDIAIVAMTFDTTPEGSGWNPDTDMDNNDIINIIDISAVAVDFGKTL